MTQHYLNLSARFDDEGRVIHVPFDYIWGKFNALAEELGGRSDIHSVSVTAIRAGESDEDEEYFDEYTIFKVFDAIKNSGPGFTEGMVREIIDNMQNAGILFRERGSRS